MLAVFICRTTRPGYADLINLTNLIITQYYLPKQEITANHKISFKWFVKRLVVCSRRSDSRAWAKNRRGKKNEGRLFPLVFLTDNFKTRYPLSERMEQANRLVRVSHEKRTEMNTTYTLPFPGYRTVTLLSLPIWEINKKV